MPTQGDRFRAQLDRANITQADFAKYTGNNRRTVQRWANDDSPVPSEAWYAINTLLQYGPKQREQKLKRGMKEKEIAKNWGNTT